MRPDVTIGAIHSYLLDSIRAEKDENNKICLVTLLMLLTHTEVSEILPYIYGASAVIDSVVAKR